MKNNSYKKIAIVRLSALGDIVNSAIVLQFIHQQFPDTKIEWITEEIFSPILKSHPLLSAVHTINLKRVKKTKSFSQLKETIKKLHSLGPYDTVIDMQGLIKSAIVSRIISKNVYGFDKNSIRESFASILYNKTSHIAYDENVVKRNCCIVADALNFTINNNMILNKKAIFPYKESSEVDKSIKNIAIVIGASWKSKKYPKELILQVCEAIKEKCYIIWGNELEKEEALWISNKSKYAILAPKLSLGELVSFISSVDLLIGNDTGPTHIAWAQNIPSITLLGPTTDRMIQKTSKNIAIKSPSKVDIFHINKNDFSIKYIEVNQILTNAKELLKQ